MFRFIYAADPHHRPLIWHLWDIHKNGFSALVNYHKVNHASDRVNGVHLTREQKEGARK